MSYNQWLKKLQKVSLEKRKRREDAEAIFRYMKDFMVLEKVEVIEKEIWAQNKNFLAARAGLPWNPWELLGPFGSC